jgi:putative transposase
MSVEEVERKNDLMARLDFWHTKMPYLGARKLTTKLIEEGHETNRKETGRLMREMGIYAMYPLPNLSRNSKQHKVFPYMLRNMSIFIPNQVWAVDITYIRMQHGHMYLTAIIDWYSRFILGWELSDSLETAPVLDAMRRAIGNYGLPGIANSDQGSQFTSDEYIELLRQNGIRQSMDGKARWVDNVIIERWFRSLKYEAIFINEYNTPNELSRGIRGYIEEYNWLRPHQSLGNRSPGSVFHAAFEGASANLDSVS